MRKHGIIWCMVAHFCPLGCPNVPVGAQFACGKFGPGLGVRPLAALVVSFFISFLRLEADCPVGAANRAQSASKVFENGVKNATTISS
mgnify:FL=1